MGLFSGPEEQERKAKLKTLEDKRVAFSEKLASQGFAPEKMLFAQTMKGGFVAVCAHAGRNWLIISPDFGADDDYIMEEYDRAAVRKTEVLVKGEGMGGIFGFGKKGEQGYEYAIARQGGGEAVMSFVSGRNGWAEYKYAKNPFLKTQRRRGNANVVWDMKPVEAPDLRKITATVEQYFDIPQ